MKSGFTLLEAIIAIFILTIGIVAVLQVFPLAFGIELANQRETQAAMLCQEKVEEINFKNYGDIQVGSQSEDPLPPPFERFSRQTTINYFDSNSGTTTTSDTGLKKIEIEVRWSSFFPSGEKQVKITTLIAEK